MPSLYAFIMIALPTIAFVPLSVSLGAITCHVSYPLNAESARPSGTLTVDLSWALRITVATKTDAAATRTDVTQCRFISVPLLSVDCHASDVMTPDTGGGSQLHQGMEGYQRLIEPGSRCWF